MKCLVTGGAGFIGSNLALELEKQGHEVIVADNFLTGRSIIEDIGNFFGNNVDFFKGLFAKDEIGVRNVNVNIIDGPIFICNENAIRCNTGFECSGSPCVMKCQNNAWTEYQYCQETCSNGQCVSCYNQCDYSGQKQCSGTGYQTCGYYAGYCNGQVLSWGGITACPRNTACIDDGSGEIACGFAA